MSQSEIRVYKYIYYIMCINYKYSTVYDIIYIYIYIYISYLYIHKYSTVYVYDMYVYISYISI